MPLDSQTADFLRGLVVALDPIERFRATIGEPDDWQQELLTTGDEFVTVLASRQVGKSTGVACLAYDAFCHGETVLLAAPAQSQSQEFLRRCLDFKNADPCAPRVVRQTLSTLEGVNGGRIVSVPATDTARGYTADILVLDEAAFLEDPSIAALLPMRQASGRVLMLSTPKGREGFFYDTWARGSTRRIHARSVDIPRLREKVAFDRRHMSEIRFRTEHMCEFVGAGVPLIAHETMRRAINKEVSALWV